jgi:hypothetical protein
VVSHNAAATELHYQAMCDVYKGIMPIKKVGQTHIWYTPWDFLIRWWGIENAMMDMIDRPELVLRLAQAVGEYLRLAKRRQAQPVNRFGAVMDLLDFRHGRSEFWLQAIIRCPAPIVWRKRPGFPGLF